MTRSARIFLILGWALALLSPLSAHAVLGERAPSSLTKSKAAVASTATVRFQASQDDVVSIKEFVDQTGLVYAIRWEGPRPPDLPTLLGQYFPEYQVAIVSTPFRVPHRRLMATSNNLHISQFGHPGALFGIVYLKNKLPADIRPEDLK
jgi:hypothetical protein